jgi:hypothetical protein
MQKKKWQTIRTVAVTMFWKVLSLRAFTEKSTSSKYQNLDAVTVTFDTANRQDNLYQTSSKSRSGVLPQGKL